jgi:hypothetical protein
MVHGNVHPGTTLIGNDGRVVLADARADSADSVELDIRSVGAVLYFALTGRWPHAEAGQSALPDANRDASGNPSTPRQIRAGVPAYLDDLTMDLLDRRVAPPTAEALTVELSRLDSSEEEYEDVGPLRFVQSSGSAEPVRSTRKILLGVGTLVVIAVIGLVFGIRAITNSNATTPKKDTQAGASTTTGTAPDPSGAPTAAPAPKPIPLTGDMVRIVDPPPGDRNDKGEARFTVDDDPNTAWKTQHFKRPNFGGNKAGMGILINLGRPRNISEVSVEANMSGASMKIMTGTSDPGDTSAGDQQILSTYKNLSDAEPGPTDGTRTVLSGFDANTQYQYILVFLTNLPPSEDDPSRYAIIVNKLSISGY